MKVAAEATAIIYEFNNCQLCVFRTYGITEGLIYSFPCRCANGDWAIVQDVEVGEFSRGKLTATEQELTEERDAVQHLLP